MDADVGNVRAAHDDDLPAIVDIYAYHVLHGRGKLAPRREAVIDCRRHIAVLGEPSDQWKIAAA